MMFKFLFSKKSAGVKETQRDAIVRAVGEINLITAQMAVKPRIIIDPATGSVTFELPDQMPDEALMLPAPDAEEASGIEAKVPVREAA
jgi:hypothetical protein